VAKPSNKNNKHFKWEGKNASGKTTSGLIAAKNISAARAKLRKNNIVVRKLRQQSTTLENLTKARIKSAEIALFSRQLATMIAAGVPLLQSLDIVCKGAENPTLRKILLQVKSSLEQGETLSQALSRHPKHFDSLFCSLINAGEKSGTLETMLDRIATYREKTESLKKKIRKALTYPTIVVVIAFVVTSILLIKVIPAFEGIFAGAGAELPAFTLFVVKISIFFQNYWWLMLASFVLSITLIVVCRSKFRRFRKITDKIFLTLPIIGPILKKAAIARFCRTLATTFAAGMPMLSALKVSSKATGNLVYEDAITDIQKKITVGDQLHVAIENSGNFPNMIVQMAAIGEESAELDAMMNKAASIYEEDVDTAVDSLSSLLEPVIMAVIGVLIGGLVIAMYLPIFKLGDIF
jgi:type IV pilus assembly protein PilC